MIPIEKSFLKIEKILEHYFQTKLDNAFLKKNAPYVGELSSLFVSDKDKVFFNKDYMAIKAYQNAYNLYYFPVNVCKVVFLTGRVIPKNSNFSNKVSILDIGCGPGTAAIGAMIYFSLFKSPPSIITIVSVDQSAAILTENKKLIKIAQKILLPNSKVIHKLLKLTLSPKMPALLEDLKIKYDFIFCCNILSELSESGTLPQPDGLVLRLPQGAAAPVSTKKYAKKTTSSILPGWNVLNIIYKNLLSPSGLVFQIEPAQKIYSRRLLQMRDKIAASPAYNILYPCIYKGECPALDPKGKDWCHSSINWERLRHIDKLDKLIGLRKDFLKFTSLVFAKHKNEGKQDSINQDITRWLVVSNPIKEKGKISFFLCGKNGRFRFELLIKHKSTSNSPFFTLERGMEISLSGIMQKNTIFRINNKSIVLINSHISHVNKNRCCLKRR